MQPEAYAEGIWTPLGFDRPIASIVEPEPSVADAVRAGPTATQVTWGLLYDTDPRLRLPATLALGYRGRRL